MNKDLQKLLKEFRKKQSGTNQMGIQLNIGDDGVLKMRGADGYTPVKGVDYWTPEEIDEIVSTIFKAAKPERGVHYYTEAEKREFVADVLKLATPIKGVHYRDGIDGRDGRDGKDADEIDARQVAIDAINFLETFEGDARLSAKALKDLDEAVTEILKKGADFELSEKQITTIKDLMPKYPPINAGGSGATFLRSLRDVDLSGLTKNADGKYVLGGGSGASSFLALADTPSSYTGQAGKLVAVNTGETGVEFIAPPSGSGDVVGPSSSTADAVAIYNGTTGKVIKDSATTIAAIRDRSTHTGTQVASTISDFDAEVSNNTDVAANTAARHTHTNKSILDATTASFTTADETKLDGIESGAEVNNISDANATDLTDGGDTTLHTHDGRYYTETEIDGFLAAKQDESVVVSGSLTASNDTVYHNVASATYTDPSPVEGKGFVVFVRNGTATVGGTGYATAGTIVHRIFHSGAWANYVYQVSSTFAAASHTHTASQVTDFDTEVSNNTDVAANTAARHTRSHAITSTSDHTATAHRVFYSDASGNITELALGASGTYLKSNGATSAPSFDTAPVTTTNTVSLENKEIVKRVTSETSSATPTINIDNTDIHRITAQAVAITSMTTNLSGTAYHGQMLIIEITGTASRAITWGASFEATTVALPTTTSGTATLRVGFIWNSATSKFSCIAVA